MGAGKALVNLRIEAGLQEKQATGGDSLRSRIRVDGMS